VDATHCKDGVTDTALSEAKSATSASKALATLWFWVHARLATETNASSLSQSLFPEEPSTAKTSTEPEEDNSDGEL